MYSAKNNNRIMARSESRLVDVLRTKDIKTEKGMVTNSTSLDACVDMFFMAGATRHWDKEKRQLLFQKALTENPLVAMKLLFWARDVRSGAGERDFFRDGMELLNDMYPDYLHINAHLIPEFGRWDDLFTIDSDISIPLVRKGLEDGNALLAKWLPRKSQYNNFAKKVRESLGLTPKEYRKMIVEMSNTIEQKMCGKKFEEIDYQGVPSIAMNKYRTSFYRNDEDRFKKYIDDVTSGEAKINAGVIYPYMLYRALSKGGRADRGTFKVNENAAIEAQWNALPNFMEGSEHRIMPLIDVSPSMTWNNGLPLEVSISLGIYISERNESIFKDAFMTFSENPTIEFLKGSFAERAYRLRYAKWGGTTNIERAFDNLLTKSVEYGIDEKYMPTMLLIISDMQFDTCTNINSTAMEMIKSKYRNAGYQLPQIVFWNVRAEINNVPSEDNEKGVGLISGFSPSILKDILKGEINRKPTPLETMMNVVDSGRYDAVVV